MRKQKQYALKALEFEGQSAFEGDPPKCETGLSIRKSRIYWSHPSDLNRRPFDYESNALPTELGWLEMYFAKEREWPAIKWRILEYKVRDGVVSSNWGGGFGSDFVRYWTIRRIGVG